jgi:hypothetical protein
MLLCLLGMVTQFVLMGLLRRFGFFIRLPNVSLRFRKVRKLLSIDVSSRPLPEQYPRAGQRYAQNATNIRFPDCHWRSPSMSLSRWGWTLTTLAGISRFYNSGLAVVGGW